MVIGPFTLPDRWRGTALMDNTHTYIHTEVLKAIAQLMPWCFMGTHAEFKPGHEYTLFTNETVFLNHFIIMLKSGYLYSLIRPHKEIIHKIYPIWEVGNHFIQLYSANKQNIHSLHTYLTWCFNFIVNYFIRGKNLCPVKITLLFSVFSIHVQTLEFKRESIFSALHLII